MNLISETLNDVVYCAISLSYEIGTEPLSNEFWSFNEDIDPYMSFTPKFVKEHLTPIQQLLDELNTSAAAMSQGSTTFDGPALHKSAVTILKKINELEVIVQKTRGTDNFSEINFSNSTLYETLNNFSKLTDANSYKICIENLSDTNQTKPEEAEEHEYINIAICRLISAQNREDAAAALTQRQKTVDKVKADRVPPEYTWPVDTAVVACFGSDRGGYRALQHYYEAAPRSKTSHHFADEQRLLQGIRIDRIYSADIERVNSKRSLNRRPNPNRWASKSMVVAMLVENLFRYYAGLPLIQTDFILERNWPGGGYTLLSTAAYSNPNQVKKEEYVTAAELRMIYRLMGEIPVPVVNDIMEHTTRFVRLGSTGEGNKGGDGFDVTSVTPVDAPWQGANAEKWINRQSEGGPLFARKDYQNLSKRWMSGLMYYHEDLISFREERVQKKGSITPKRQAQVFTREEFVHRQSMAPGSSYRRDTADAEQWRIDRGKV